MVPFTRVAPAIAALILAAGLPAGAGALAAAPGDLAGVSAAVRGNVLLTSVLTKAAHAATSGEDVLFGDAVQTADSSGMQLLLLDESVFTIGANAKLVVDAFVYDPASGEGRLAADLLKGAFRFVSGGLSARDPKQVELRLPEATIGIRGTIVSALVTPEGSYVLLDGPGRGNDAFARRGAVLVTAHGATVELRRPGFATFVPNGGVPAEPFRASAELRQRFASALAAQPASRRAGLGLGELGDPVGASGVTTTEAFAALPTLRAAEAISEFAFDSAPDDPNGRGASSGMSTEVGTTSDGAADSGLAATGGLQDQTDQASQTVDTGSAAASSTATSSASGGSSGSPTNPTGPITNVLLVSGPTG
ncbi:FecR family protein [Tistlia consotensis]|uniref:FecR family protein n=1 Tax=Tistlia consotensis USBA 355 TaxID=560819 RepID=A0A1Y6BQ16_9PROT|nr:FecR domain-containing protein [Tistlia consotensis]SMF14636.1 FecR family protein [Tistlia consotensis USBA 355]SNR49394.1 FecR family protein [Tistlia consotensis]